MISKKQIRTLDVLEAVLFLKGRIYFDTQRNRLFKFLDTHSKKLDAIAEIKIRNFDMSQYAMFRDITEDHYDVKAKMASMAKLIDIDRRLVKTEHDLSELEDNYNYFDEDEDY
jgi:hypothetical protein